MVILVVTAFQMALAIIVAAEAIIEVDVLAEDVGNHKN